MFPTCLSFAACTFAMVVWAQGANLIGAMMAALGIAMVGAVAMSVLSPLAVPCMAWLFGLLLPGNTLAGLAQANLRDGVRRGAAIASPLIVLAALLLGLAGTFGSLAAAGGAEAQRSVNGQLVVTSTGEEAERLPGIEGVAAASRQNAVDIAKGSEVLDLTGGQRSWPDELRALWRDCLARASHGAMDRTPPWRGVGGLSDILGELLEVPDHVYVTSGVRALIPAFTLLGRKVIVRETAHTDRKENGEPDPSGHRAPDHKWHIPARRGSSPHLTSSSPRARS